MANISETELRIRLRKLESYHNATGALVKRVGDQYEYTDDYIYLAYASALSNLSAGKITSQQDATNFQFSPYNTAGVLMAYRGFFINRSIYQSGDPTDYTWESTSGQSGYTSSERYYTTSTGLVENLGNPINPGSGVTWTVITAGTAVPGTAVWIAERFTIDGVPSIWSIYPVSAYIGSGQIVDSAVIADKIATNAVTTAKILNNAIDADKIANNAVTTAAILNDAIDSDKIAANAVTTAAIIADAIDATKIADNAVVTAAIATNAVVTNNIAANAITANEISANAVTANEIAANAITASKILAGEIGASHIAANSLTAGQIATNAITADEIQAGAIGVSELAANSVTADAIAANTITATEIQADAIGVNELAANSVTADAIAANSVTASEIAGGTITASEIAADAITANAIATNAVTADAITAGTITADEIASNAITSAKVNADAITVTKIDLDGTLDVTANSGAITWGKTGPTDTVNTGLFLGRDGSGNPRLVFGNASSFVHFDGTDVSLVNCDVDNNNGTSAVILTDTSTTGIYTIGPNIATINIQLSGGGGGGGGSGGEYGSAGHTGGTTSIVVYTAAGAVRTGTGALNITATGGAGGAQGSCGNVAKGGDGASFTHGSATEPPFADAAGGIGSTHVQEPASRPIAGSGAVPSAGGGGNGGGWSQGVGCGGGVGAYNSTTYTVHDTTDELRITIGAGGDGADEYVNSAGDNGGGGRGGDGRVRLQGALA